MATFAFIIGHPHGVEKKPVIIIPPDYDVDGVKNCFKNEFLGDRVHPEFARVELHNSRRGEVRGKNFITPDEAERRAKAMIAEEKAAAKAAKPKAKKDAPDPSPDPQPESSP
jgi:hypothetical protein